MKKIKIAIIAHNCREGGGLVGTLNLVKAFKDVAQNVQFLLVCSAGYGYEEIELPLNSELFVYRGRQSPLARLWFDKVTLPKVVRRYNPDVIFGPGNIGLTHAGVPLITSDSPRWQGPEIQVFTNGKTGLLYRYADIDDLALKIEELLKNTGLRKEMGDEARRTIFKEYTIEKMCHGFINGIMYAMKI